MQMLLSNLHRKPHWGIASSLYEPVGVYDSSSRPSNLFLTVVPHRLRYLGYSVLPQDHQGTRGPFDDAEEAMSTPMPK